MNTAYLTRPSLAELAEIERLDRAITTLSRRVDSGPHSLAHAAILAGITALQKG